MQKKYVYKSGVYPPDLFFMLIFANIRIRRNNNEFNQKSNKAA